jgi:hypothetical protein
MNGHSLVRYRDLAPVYVLQGYRAPIPLPQGRKHPPPVGFTGYSALLPSDEQIEEWREKRGDDGIAFVLQDGQIVIDVDNYAKGDWPAGSGVATLTDARERAGCGLPPGPKLRNRTDGSEKRPFRVPSGLKFKKSLGPCVDIVTPTHRYVNAGINPDTGQAERWFDADDKPLAEPPSPQSWPELPAGWVSLLIQGFSDGPTTLATDEQALAWIDGMPEGPISFLVQEQLECALAGLSGHCANPEHGSRHDCCQEHVRWIVQDGAAGLTGAKVALSFLRDRFVEAVAGDRSGGEREARIEFDGFVKWGARVCRPDVFYAIRGLDISRGQLLVSFDDADEPSSGGRYRLVSARELAQPVEPMRWLVRGIWPERSAGVLAGDKKSLKTWNLQALGLTVASGTAFFDNYHVTSPGAVLYLCGEGGLATFANRHQAIAERLGIKHMLAELPFSAEFGVGMLTDSEFVDTVKRHLDAVQPTLVILDPLYAYHPQDVETSNLCARGQMLANVRELVGDEAALIVGDHFKKTAGSGLDLDNISMSGMSQWADSWILQKHRMRPDLENGKFFLEVESGTRRGPGKHIEVDWTLERDTRDPDVLAWSGVDWETRPASAASADAKGDKVVDAILQIVGDCEWELTESQVVEKVGGRREKAREVMLELKVNGWLRVENRERPEGNRSVRRDVVGLGPAAKRCRGSSSGPGTGSRTANASEEGVPDAGTGSERVDDDNV